MVTTSDPRTTLQAARRRGLSALDEPTGKELLAKFGLQVPAHCIVGEIFDLSRIESELRPPYVLKAVSSKIVHKSEFGAVKLGLQSGQEVARCLESMRATLALQGIPVERWLVEETAPAGVELVIGGVIDPEFGPMIMVGLGGVLVELMDDVAFRICPIRSVDAEEMLKELRGAALLRGARGREPVSIDAIVDALLRIGGDSGLLMTLVGELAELDVNPLIVSHAGAIAADARFILSGRA